MLRRHRTEIILVAAIVVLIAFYARWEYKPFFFERHVNVFEERYGVEVGDPGPWFAAWALGDGQAYALIAADPSGKTMASGIDEAGYRFARAGHGWATWAASLGQNQLVPYALAGVGGLATVGVMVVAIRKRLRLGPRSWLMVANPALYIGFAGDTSEPLGILFLAIALGWGSWLGAVLLGLSRPTFFVALWGRWKLLIAGVGAAAALALYSTIAFGWEAMVPAGGRLGLPGLAFIEHPSIWGILLALAAGGTIMAGVRNRDWAWVLAGVFVLCFGGDVLRDPVNAWRAAGHLPVIWAFGPGYEPDLVPDSSSFVSVES